MYVQRDSGGCGIGSTYIIYIYININIFKRNKRLVRTIVVKTQGLFKIKHVITNRVKILTTILYYVFKLLTSVYY